jgi:D,D-heptose 1,7-bisphosphate phosphatase
MDIPKQCAILVGGEGTRLGQLTANTPKPLLKCGDRPFLAWLLRELCRYGIEDVVLLAGYKSECVRAFCQTVERYLPRPMKIEVSIEPERAGTAGAVWYARNLLQDTFMLINGDSWIDTNLARAFSDAVRIKEALGYVLLHNVKDCSRYGTVELRDGRITAFLEKCSLVKPGLINSGIYILNKDILSELSIPCSLEMDVLPALAAKQILCGKVMDGYFIDIGIPNDYARAQTELPQRLKRPAIIFDRDGVLNEDLGWVGTVDRFVWTKNARQAIQYANDHGYHAFVATNQAGVAKGLYEEDDVVALHRFMQNDLLEFGATIDDIRYCPFHPDARRAEYRCGSDWRKPSPGMIMDLIQKWSIDTSKSLLIGDKDTDIAAAEAAQIPGYLFKGGNLLEFVHERISESIGDTSC